jgi:hypothetical protein
MANIARDGAPKKLPKVQIHGGMYSFTKNGILARGLSRSQAAEVHDGGLPVDTLTTGAIEKRFYSEGPAVPVVNHRSRTGNAETRPSASQILREASGFRDLNAPGANKPRRA